MHLRYPWRPLKHHHDQAFRYFGWLTMAPLLVLHFLLCCTAFQMGENTFWFHGWFATSDGRNVGYKKMRHAWPPQRGGAHRWPGWAPCSSLAWVSTLKWDHILKWSQLIGAFNILKLVLSTLLVLVHGYQHPAHGVWYRKGRSQITWSKENQ